MNGMVEIRLHGREADVAEMVAWLESLGARFGGRIYQDRGGTGEVRAYGKAYGDELRMPAVEVAAEVEGQEGIAAGKGYPELGR